VKERNWVGHTHFNVPRVSEAAESVDGFGVELMTYSDPPNVLLLRADMRNLASDDRGGHSNQRE
jgi:hypothetical protein